MKHREHGFTRDFYLKAENNAKTTTCVLCGNTVDKFENSHSVPKMVLKSIANEQLVINSNSVMGIDSLDIMQGISTTGTFHILCHSCESSYFKYYEDPEALKKDPSDKILSEIALKNSLLQLSNTRIEIEMYKLLQKDGNTIGFDAGIRVKEKDIKLYLADINYYKDAIIKNNRQNNYQILYRKILPYTTPIAVQTEIALLEDYNGVTINDVRKRTNDYKVQFMHICVFPMKNSTLVLAFNHKRDKRYRNLREQFAELTDDESLSYINWLIIKYSSNYYFSDKVKNTIETNKRLIELSKEDFGKPNLGLINENLKMTYKPVNMYEIPNFLDKEYAI